MNTNKLLLALSISTIPLIKTPTILAASFFKAISPSLSWRTTNQARENIEPFAATKNKVILKRGGICIGIVAFGLIGYFAYRHLHKTQAPHVPVQQPPANPVAPQAQPVQQAVPGDNNYHPELTVRYLNTITYDLTNTDNELHQLKQVREAANNFLRQAQPPFTFHRIEGITFDIRDHDVQPFGQNANNDLGQVSQDLSDIHQKITNLKHRLTVIEKDQQRDLEMARNLLRTLQQEADPDDDEDF